MNDRLGAMLQFVRVIETGSFSAAARQLNLSQPSVSKAIAQLEQRLGASLLIRTTRKVTPTDAGRTFYAHALAALDAVDEAEAIVRTSATILSGPLKVCMPVTFARLHIVPKLAPFIEAHPNITLELLLDDRRIDLISEGIDLAVRAGPLDDSTLVASRLAATKRHVFASHEWLERMGPIAHPTDLIGARPVIYTRARDWIFARDGKTHLVSLPGGLEVSAVEGQRAAVLAGLGPTIASNWIFADAVADGRVSILLPDWALPQVELWTVTPVGRRINARTRAFIDFLRQLTFD